MTSTQPVARANLFIGKTLKAGKNVSRGQEDDPTAQAECFV